nr:hypothetical protein [Tanacetum cinerariifolium]
MAKFTYFKVKGKLTDFILNEVLESFQNVFPTSKGYKLPPSYYAIKKTFKTIGFWYESIHTYVIDCFLFQGEDNKDVHFYLVCNMSRWIDSNTQGKKVPKKVLRYFPIIPRLQRLYKSSHTAKAWKNFDIKYPDFAKEPRNVQLRLAADGFNPFGNLSQSYSMWPVILTTYNLPPWLCMKLQNLLSTIVAQVGDQCRGQRNGRNKNDDAVNDNLRGAIVYTRWIEKMESVQDMNECMDTQKVKYTTSSFVGKALTWWNSQIHTRGREAVVGMYWEDFKTLTREEFYPSNKMKKLEIPHLVTPKGKRIERYVYGLALQIRGMVAATEPKTIQKAIQIAGTLTDAVQERSRRLKLFASFETWAEGKRKTKQSRVWGIDYAAESPVKELSYIPVLDVSLIPSRAYDVDGPRNSGLRASTTIGYLTLGKSGVLLGNRCRGGATRWRFIDILILELMLSSGEGIFIERGKLRVATCLTDFSESEEDLSSDHTEHEGAALDRKANCLLAGSCMSGNVYVRLREKGGGQKWPCCTSLSSSMGSALSLLGEYANMILMRGRSSIVMTLSLFHGLIHVPNAHTGKLTPGSRTWGVAPRNPFFLVHSGGVNTPARITGDSYKNGGEVNSTRRHSGMDVDPSGRDNHSGPGRGGDHSQEPKRLS